MPSCVHKNYSFCTKHLNRICRRSSSLPVGPNGHLYPGQELRAVFVHDLPRLPYLGVRKCVGEGENLLRDSLPTEQRLERSEERTGAKRLRRRVYQRPNPHLSLFGASMASCFSRGSPEHIPGNKGERTAHERYEQRWGYHWMRNYKYLAPLPESIGMCPVSSCRLECQWQVSGDEFCHALVLSRIAREYDIRVCVATSSSSLVYILGSCKLICQLFSEPYFLFRFFCDNFCRFFFTER